MLHDVMWRRGSSLKCRENVRSELQGHLLGRGFIKNWRNRRILESNRRVIMEGQSSVRKQAKFSRRIVRSKRRILRSPMLNEHPG